MFDSTSENTFFGFYNSHQFVKQALLNLVRGTDLRTLQRYSDLIKKKINNTTWVYAKNLKKEFQKYCYDYSPIFLYRYKESWTSMVSYEDKYHLLSLLNLNSQEKKNLLKNNKHPLWIRVRLGDVHAEDTLINKYKFNTEDYQDMAYLAEDLSLAGTKRTMKCLVESFNTSLVHYPGESNFQLSSRNCMSFRLEILRQLGRHHISDTTFLRLSHSNQGMLSSRFICDKAKLIPLMNEFLLWIKKNYHMDIVMKKEDMYMGKDCTEGKWWCQENRDEILMKEYLSKDE